jgi:hypothetical protein
MATRVKINGRGMRSIARSSGVRNLLTDKAENVLRTAQATGPVDTGDYVESLHLVQATTDRAVVRVVSDLSYAYVVEANTGTLARALDSA